MNLFKRRAAKAKDLYQAYRRVFSTEDGQKILKDLMRSCHYNGSSVGQDVYETYYNEGERAVVLRILKTSKMTIEEIDSFTNMIADEDRDLIGGTDEI